MEREDRSKKAPTYTPTTVTRQGIRYLTDVASEKDCRSIGRRTAVAGARSRFHLRTIGERELTGMCGITAGSREPAGDGRFAADLCHHLFARPTFRTTHQHVGRISFQGPGDDSAIRILDVQ